MSTGLLINTTIQSEVRKQRSSLSNAELLSLPLSIDLRQYNLISTVQDQGNCGSCYAMVTAHIMESLILLQNSFYQVNNIKTLRLSTKQLVDQSQSNSGCQGGDFVAVLYDIRNLPIALVPDSENRYKHAFFYQSPFASIDYFFSRGVPVAGAMSVAKQGFGDQTEFTAYAGGYGKFDGVDVWVMKNSWGTGWGIHGFGYLPIGQNSMCSELYAAVALPNQTLKQLSTTELPSNLIFPQIRRGLEGLDKDLAIHDYNMIGYLKLWQLFVYVVFPSSVAGVVIGVIKGKRERVAALKKIKVPVPIAKPANQDEANNVVVLDSSPDKILFPYV